MYILYSIVGISFIGMIAVFVYHLWKIKSGKVFLSEDVENNKEYPEVVYNFCDNCVKKISTIIIKHLPWCKSKLIMVTNTVVNKSKFTDLKKIIDGKKMIESDKKSASLYLKDITEHKNSFKKNVIDS
jgi:hypothetical protein